MELLQVASGQPLMGNLLLSLELVSNANVGNVQIAS